MKFSPIIYLIGMLLCILSIFMIVPAFVDWFYGNENWPAFVGSSMATLFVGLILFLTNKGSATEHLELRQAFLLTNSAWISIAIFGSLPFLLSDIDMSFVDAFFESTSGITTTGATVIENLEAKSHGILIWRALLQWLGVFTIQAKGTGDVHTLFSDITSDGFLRGYVGLNAGFKSADSNLNSLMGSGHISFTLDQGKYTKRYQGIVSLEEPNMSKTTELYFNNSEQLETKFLTFNFYDIDISNRKNLFSAGLIMLQKLPVKSSFDEESNEEVWQNSLNFLSTLGKEEFLSTNLTSEEILYRLFNELEITVYNEIIIQDQCRCSDKKIKFAIKNLSKKELQEIADENGNVKVVCEFCKTERIFPSKTCN